MDSPIDINFDFCLEIPEGADPDQRSHTLRKYHKILWSKPLPSGEVFDLDESGPRPYLYHKSHLGEFVFSSDAITHSYRHVIKMSKIINEVIGEADKLFSTGSTVGAFIVFPAIKVDNKMTINGSRGTNAKIKDRFDLTLECIRLYYMGKESPLSDTLKRYDNFFNLFQDFKGYVDFFLLQDLVTPDYSGLNFYLRFYGFEHEQHNPLPQNKEEYLQYKRNTIAFIRSRAQRMLLSIK